MMICEQVERRFQARGSEVVALGGVSLEIERGEFVVIRGPSGCGKSTLLLTLGGMQRPSAGRVVVSGRDLYAIPASERNRVRSQEIGFVFQLFHLIPYLTVRENVLAGMPSGEEQKGASVDELLGRLGLSSRAGHRPGTLSAGERQRVGLARALIKKPAVILADEPTGNLDPINAAEVFWHLAEFRRGGGTVVVVSHGEDAGVHASRTIWLRDGRIVPGVEGSAGVAT